MGRSVDRASDVFIEPEEHASPFGTTGLLCMRLWRASNADPWRRPPGRSSNRRRMSAVPPRPPRTHNRQLVLDVRAHCIHPDWKALDVGNGYVLSYCPNLRLRSFPRPAGDPRVLIGHAFQADPEREPVAEGLGTEVEADLAEATHGWSGRWVVISDGVVLGDFSNSLGLFYCHEEDTLLVSSSLGILKTLIPERRLIHRRFNRRGMNWTPPPVTRLERVRKLLPDQVIDLRAGEIRPVAKRHPRPNRSLDAETAGALLLAALQSVWRQMAAEFRRLRLALTAGRDSRTLMAAGLSAGVRFDAVTLQHGRISRADRRLPEEICARSAVPYQYVRSGTIRADLERLYDEHTLADVDEADRDYWRRDMFSWLEEGDGLVRGACFELGREHFHPVFFGLTWEAVAQNPLLLVRRFGDFASFKLEAAQLSEWIAWRARHPGPYGWIEMFHLDQRLCGWAAAGEQSLDLLCGTSINPANCGYVVDLMLCAAPPERRAGAVQLACLQQSGTGLERFPINPNLDGIWSRSAARLRQVVGRATIEGANLLGI